MFIARKYSPTWELATSVGLCEVQTHFKYMFMFSMRNVAPVPGSKDEGNTSTAQEHARVVYYSTVLHFW